MSNSRKFLYSLNEEEKKHLSFELSKENVPYVLIELKRSFNQIYQLLMNVFKKLFITKKNNNILDDELKNYIIELEKNEKNILRQYKIMMIYLKLANVDINKDEIMLEFDSELEKNEFLKVIKERSFQLKIFSDNLKKLENLKLKVNAIFERLNSSSDIDNPE